MSEPVSNQNTPGAGLFASAPRPPVPARSRIADGQQVSVLPGTTFTAGSTTAGVMLTYVTALVMMLVSSSIVHLKMIDAVSSDVARGLLVVLATCLAGGWMMSLISRACDGHHNGYKTTILARTCAALAFVAATAAYVYALSGLRYLETGLRLEYPLGLLCYCTIHHPIRALFTRKQPVKGETTHV